MHIGLFVPLCILFAGGILSAPYQDQTIEEPKINYRLDGSVIPSNYKIVLTPYILENEQAGKERFTFDGVAYITLKPTKANLKTIVLHAKALLINAKDVELITLNEIKKIEITKLEQDEKTDKLSVQLKDELVKDNEYVLTFKYVGKMGDDMKGFYKSYYKDSTGKQVWLASTQFQTHHARRAFPCFDEPKYKATFHIEINRHASLKSVSNTRLFNSIEGRNGRFTDIFKTTPKMSTYLVAFLVSDFKPRSEEGGRTFSVLARPDAFEQTKFSYDIGKEVLAKFDEYLGVKYELLGNDKMDMAAIPDFNAGAMENWGLLTFRERALLYDASTSTLNYQQSIALVVAHEQAHMWFGDYITCEWWSYAWLNEGFARYFQYFMMTEIKPDWELNKQFVVDQIHTAFVMDSREGTHPMSDPTAESPDDLARMFGTISYNKGASVIRMISHVLEPTNFKSALQSYMKNNVQTTAIPETLFKELKKKWTGTGVDFEQFLKDFTEQVGYPLVTVKMSEDGKSLTVSQERFLLNSLDGSDATLTYTIPFTYTTDKDMDFSKTKPTTFLKKSDKQISVPLKDKTDFVIANIQQTGYYRVNYDEATWHKIHKYLNSDNFVKVDEINRAQIIDDLFNLGRAKILSYDLVLDILEYLTRETSYIPWTAALNGYSNIATRLGTNHLELFGKHMLRLTKKVYEKLGFNEQTGESRLDTYNRAKVLNWACQYGNKDCISKAKESFAQLVQKNTAVPINIRQPIYCAAIREGSATDFEFLWTKYMKENVATEQVLILNALGCAKSKDIIDKYLKHILSENVRRQDKSAALSSTYSQNPENVQHVLEYVLKNYKDFSSSFGGMSEVATALNSIASRIASKEQLSALKKFYDDKKSEFGDSAKTLEKALKNAEENLKWSASVLPHIMDVVKAKNSGNLIKSFNILVAILFAVFAM